MSAPLSTVGEWLNLDETAMCHLHGAFYSGFHMCPTCQAIMYTDDTALPDSSRNSAEVIEKGD